MRLSGNSTKIHLLAARAIAQPPPRKYCSVPDDEWNLINVVVSPGVVLRDGRHLHSGRVLLIEGVVQREGEVINLIAQRVGPVTVE
jgi:hypothetical protein